MRTQIIIRTVSGLLASLAIMTSTAALAEPPYYRTWHENVSPRIFQQPIRRDAAQMPRAFYDQQQPGYPQSPPGGGY